MILMCTGPHQHHFCNQYVCIHVKSVLCMIPVEGAEEEHYLSKVRQNQNHLRKHHAESKEKQQNRDYKGNKKKY